MASITLVSKDVLTKAPAKATKVFLCASKISNDLNIATKHMWYARNTYFRDCNEDDFVAASASRSVFLHRIIMLAGHAQECFNFLESSPVRFMTKSGAMDNYEHFASTIKELKAYFTNHNLITSLRNKLSFHTDPAFLYETLQKMPEGYKFDIITGDFLGHIVFCGVDKLIERCVYDASPSQELPKKPLYDLASDQIFQVTDSMGVLLQMLIAQVALEYLKLDPIRDFNEIELPSGPPIDSVKLPFFCAPPADAVTRKRIMGTPEPDHGF